MDKPTCGTCRHWKPFAGDDVEVYGNSPEWGACGGVPFRTDRTDDDHRDKTRRPGFVAVVEDGSGFHAALLSRAEFGCVLHEPAGTTDHGEA